MPQPEPEGSGFLLGPDPHCRSEGTGGQGTSWGSEGGRPAEEVVSARGTEAAGRGCTGA